MHMMIEAYGPTIGALGAMAGLMLLQIVVLDVVGIRAKHMPGAAVEVDHSNLLFRVTRTHANTNEVIAVFMLLVLFCLFSSASVVWVNGLACAFVLSRVLFTACYYLNAKLMRSTIFGVSLAIMIGLFITGALSWFAKF